MRLKMMIQVIVLGLCSAGILGCASTANNPDPYQKTNRFMYKVNETLDHYALKPASDVYVKVVPAPARHGVGHAFDNLAYLNVILNDFLQAKWGQGLADSGRMGVNTTVGIAGLFDVGTGWGLPAHSNDFGLTLGQWGCKQGPYLFLPVFGPSTVRDAPGIGVRVVTDPIFWIGPPWFCWVPLEGTDLIDARSRAEVSIRFRNQAALDPYVFTRDAYLQYREAQLHGSHSPATTQKSIYDEDEDSTPPKPRGPAVAPGTGGPSGGAIAPTTSPVPPHVP